MFKGSVLLFVSYLLIGFFFGKAVTDKTNSRINLQDDHVVATSNEILDIDVFQNDKLRKLNPTTEIRILIAPDHGVAVIEDNKTSENILDDKIRYAIIDDVAEGDQLTYVVVENGNIIDTAIVEIEFNMSADQKMAEHKITSNMN